MAAPSAAEWQLPSVALYHVNDITWQDGHAPEPGTWRAQDAAGQAWTPADSSWRTEPAQTWTRCTAYVMRALPGSGKSSLAERLIRHWHTEVPGAPECEFTPGPAAKLTCTADGTPYSAWLSADFYFERDGAYVYDASQISNAHGAVDQELRTGAATVCAVLVLDNTATQAREWVSRASDLHSTGFDVQVVSFVCPNEAVAAACGARNGHGVPADKVLVMWRRWEQEVAAFKVHYVRPAGIDLDLFSRQWSMGQARARLSKAMPRYMGGLRLPRAGPLATTRYVGLFLAPGEHQLLTSVANPAHVWSGGDLFAHHVTCVFQPSDEQAAAWPDGLALPVLVTHVVHSDAVSTCVVQLPSAAQLPVLIAARGWTGEGVHHVVQQLWPSSNAWGTSEQVPPAARGKSVLEGARQALVAASATLGEKGSTPHITLSACKGTGAVESNRLLARLPDGWQGGGEFEDSVPTCEWRPTPTIVRVHKLPEPLVLWTLTGRAGKA